MAKRVLVVGDAGRGKSTSIKTLNPKETFIINCVGKDLPFRGSEKNYTPFDAKKKTGNRFDTDNTSVINRVLKYISEDESMKHIKNVVIDDFQYTMSNEFFRRTGEKSYQKFNDIGYNTWSVINTAKEARNDLIVYVLTHADTSYDDEGNKIVKAKTIGKMVDNYITFEGLFTVVLYSYMEKKDEGFEYGFLTQNTGNNTGKSPEGMFEEMKIPNDLSFVSEKIRSYYGG